MFRHEAFAYHGAEHFYSGVSTFVLDGLAQDAAVLVVVPGDRLQALRDGLGADARRVSWLDMAEVGRNPARIIPMWRQWLSEQDGRTCRGVGEPAFAGRTLAAMVECHQHETLVNLAFADSDWRLLCAHDVRVLGETELARARANHPFVDGADNPGYDHRDDGCTLAQPLPEPFGATALVRFDADSIAGLRDYVAGKARLAGLGGDSVDQLTLAVHEVMVNSVDHGGGGGMLRLWTEEGDVVCEVRDEGVITDPLIGRRRPAIDQRRGRGMWMVNHLCDLVQVRSAPDFGTVVRLRMALAPTH